MYDEKTIEDAIDWALDPNNPPTKCLAASIKFACKNKLTKPKPKAVEKSVVDIASYNKVYFREINTTAHKNGISLKNQGLKEGTQEYLETENAKIYYKDRGFLNQIENWIRKKSIVCANIFRMIKACQNDFAKQLS